MSTRPRVYACVVLLALAVTACGESTAPDTASVREIWYQKQSGLARARPAVSGTIAFFGTGAGSVIARQVSTGAPIWETVVSRESIDGARLVVRSNVVVAPSVFETAGIDAQSGKQLWTYRAPVDTVGVPPSSANPGQVVDSRIDADNETVYIPAWGASVSAVDIHSGVARWVWRPGKIEGDTASSGVFRSGSTGVRVSGDTVFATMWHDTNRKGGTSEAWVVAIQTESGAELWKVKLPFLGCCALIQTAPAVYKNLVIVHTGVSARTYAIDRVTQKIAWEFSAPNNTLSTSAGPEVWGNIVYVDGGDGQIYALRAADGSIVWKAPFGNGSTSRDMLVTDRNIIFTTGELHILDRETGRQIKVFSQPHTSDPLFSSPAQAASGLVFINVAEAAWCFEEP